MTERPAKRQRLDLSDTIVISAGEGDTARDFSVPTSLAISSSKFIKAALSRDWKEAQQQRISLLDTDPETLEGYLNWIYTKQITTKEAQEHCKDCRTNGFASSKCPMALSLELAKMYTLGDYLDDLQFCNAIADEVRPLPGHSGRLPSLDTTEWMWEHTSPDFPLREHCLCMWKRALTVEHIQSSMEEHSSDFPQKFLVDLLVSIGKQYRTEINQGTRAWLFGETEQCRYHKHVDDLDKCV